MSGRPLALALALVASLALVACGGATATSAPGTLAPPTAGPGAPPVAIIDNAFQPRELTVAAGTAVTWTNNGQRGHTVTSSDGIFGSDGTLSSGAVYTNTFTTAGTYPYFCALHGSMKGTITVTP